ncbi:MAG: NTP transferase domain-containing protein [Clostridia bacterium]|nr:NTP transferase domain-containing protein [Clostridia bacterium]
MAFDATLVVLAAGMGSRFGGLKQIEPIGPNGEALLDFSVHDAKKAGFNKVVFIIKHAIEKDFKDTVGKRIEKIIDVEYVFQETDKLPSGFTCPEGREKPWGTGHAVYCLKGAVNEPFAVINADDYYGAEAFKQIYDYLKSDSDNYCMVGFRLANTLTDNGSVSRGVCEVENGKLKKVTERTKIVDCKYTEDDVNWTELPKDTLVSMNMWGFNPDLFRYTEELFVDFLKEKIDVPKSEFYLPSIVSALMEKGVKEVAVLKSEDKWYGVTYKEDKEDVKNALAYKISKGEYKF